MSHQMLLDRIKNLKDALATTVNNHHVIAGRIAECEDIAKLLFPQAAPIIEGVEAVQSVIEGEHHAAS